MHVEPQSVVPVVHAEAHWNVLPEATQTGVEPEHAVLHAPQVLGCVKLASQPSVGLPLQSAYPAAQADDENEQCPPRHATEPLTLGRLVQSLEHEPQRVGAVRSSGQPCPVAAQSPNPVAQV